MLWKGTAMFVAPVLPVAVLRSVPLLLMVPPPAPVKNPCWLVPPPSFRQSSITWLFSVAPVLSRI